MGVNIFFSLLEIAMLMTRDTVYGRSSLRSTEKVSSQPHLTTCLLFITFWFTLQLLTATQPFSLNPRPHFKPHTPIYFFFNSSKFDLPDPWKHKINLVWPKRLCLQLVTLPTSTWIPPFKIAESAPVNVLHCGVVSQPNYQVLYDRPLTRCFWPYLKVSLSHTIKTHFKI